MKNQTITILVSEGERWLNIDGDKELLNSLVAVLRGERGPDTESAPLATIADSRQGTGHQEAGTDDDSH